MITNKQLLRQLKKSNIFDYNNIDKEQFYKFIIMVECSYNEMDKNTYRLERSLEVSSCELREFNDTLEEKVKEEVNKNKYKDHQLAEQARFASLGEMIGNISHQWRQPLNAISISASSLLMKMEYNKIDIKSTTDTCENILSYVNFLSQTIDDFGNFIKKDKKKINFYLYEVVNSTIAIVEETYKNNNIELNYESENNNKLIGNGFPNEIKQVIMNILNNAKDASINNNMKEKRIHIRCDFNNDYNNIYIQDNANGIPKEIIDKIFDPYFTTKHKSQGTGIGLFMSKNIMENNMNGKLYVENRSIILNKKKYNGACFTISIPRGE